MATIAYIRVSTILQNDARQLDGVDYDTEYVEQVSARSVDRPQLQSMLKAIRSGDTVVVHDISRLARNVADLHSLVEQITGLGAELKFIKEGLTFSSDRSNPMSELMLSLLGSVYQFERAIMLERQREGIAIAKAEGKYKGRKKKIDGAVIREMLDSGVSFRKTAENLGISLSSVQRASKAPAAA
jgi:DNA invertase Pin-like site-specific DNA recombinase